MKVLLATALAVAGLTAVAGPADAAPVSVSDVQFRWGMNNETNNRAFAGYNLFSAGMLGNPGQGNQTLNPATGATWTNGAPAGWNNNTGNVYVEKLQADGSYAAAAWATYATTKNGAPLGGPTAGTFSDHQIVIDRGAGTLDPAADDASVAWDGDFTVVYYSGLTFFYVSDPVLTLDDGAGTITATVSGYGADMVDTSKWIALNPRRVTLATIEGADVTPAGVTGATPRYVDVAYAATQDAAPQTAKTAGNAAYWGAFPQSFVDFQQCTGTGSYWYASGSSLDRNKPTLPLDVLTTPRTHTGSFAGLPGSVQSPPPGGGSGCAAPVVTTPTTPTPTPPTSAPARTKATVDQAALALTRSKGRKPSKATVTLKSAAGQPTGQVTFTCTKGKATKERTATLSGGTATAKLPKLAAGRWTVTATYAGDATFQAATTRTVRLVVR